MLGKQSYHNQHIFIHQRDTYKAQWQYPRFIQWHLLDYVVIQVRYHIDVCVTWTMTETDDCWKTTSSALSPLLTWPLNSQQQQMGTTKKSLLIQCFIDNLVTCYLYELPRVNVFLKLVSLVHLKTINAIELKYELPFGNDRCDLKTLSYLFWSIVFLPLCCPSNDLFSALNFHTQIK